MIACSSHRNRYLAANAPLFLLFYCVGRIRSSIHHVNALLLNHSRVTFSVCNMCILYYKVITQKIWLYFFLAAGCVQI